MKVYKLKEIKTKQVKGLRNKDYLLNPYLVLEYYKRKEKQIHCYIGEEDNIKLYTQEELKNYIERLCRILYNKESKQFR